MIYFSSDWHLQHRNIIKYDSRPFKDVDHMDKVIVTGATNLLRKGDTFYFLGDFFMGGSIHKAEEALFALSLTEAELVFIKGNHDGRDMIKLYKKYGAYVGEKLTIKIDNDSVTLDHFPGRTWDKSHHGAYHLYGHHHDALERKPWGRSMDVGIMTSYRILGDWIPFEWSQIHNILSKRDAKIIQDDHHTANTNP